MVVIVTILVAVALVRNLQCQAGAAHPVPCGSLVWHWGRCCLPCGETSGFSHFFIGIHHGKTGYLIFNIVIWCNFYDVCACADMVNSIFYSPNMVASSYEKIPLKPTWVRWIPKLYTNGCWSQRIMVHQVLIQIHMMSDWILRGYKGCFRNMIMSRNDSDWLFFS